MKAYNTAAYYTLGCKLNFSETSTIARNLKDAGYAKVDFEHGADVYVINTCSVTENADRKCRNIVRRAQKYNPDAKVVVLGCYAQLKPEEILKIPGVNLVLGASEKFDVAKYMEQLETDDKQAHYKKVSRAKTFYPSYSVGDRTRTFLKIQDGCDYFCSFCTIPLARGNSRSQSIAETMKVVSEIEQTDVKEVVLTGVNTGEFGIGTDENFHDLIQVLDQTEIDRFRISSIEPNLLTNEIIHFSAQSNRFVPHFHVPLQSGSNRILKDMKRKYLRELYADRVHTIKKAMPDACIGVDIIVGFPGETDEEFMETFEFVRDLPVSYFHVFTYSERPNTIANRMDHPVPMHVRNERSEKLRILSQKKRRAFNETQLGKTKTVLWESHQDEDGMMHGFTENYVKVSKPYDADLTNTFEQVTLKELAPEGVVRVG
ncbi:tRNA (N(6)-L-threonylcarbamoyladenosine(37)-C(2))-methylthiotransferase MtaB [bacterium SCSIO 12643]|nr:tRNA (N(6)-L-threonylcarbamoyladenosine(37)-C(2))-methylthiotransferase MtaB [bacterium SCSIO 12643]